MTILKLIIMMIYTGVMMIVMIMIMTILNMIIMMIYTGGMMIVLIMIMTILKMIIMMIYTGGVHRRSVRSRRATGPRDSRPCQVTIVD